MTAWDTYLFIITARDFAAALDREEAGTPAHNDPCVIDAVKTIFEEIGPNKSPCVGCKRPIPSPVDAAALVVLKIGRGGGPAQLMCEACFDSPNKVAKALAFASRFSPDLGDKMVIMTLEEWAKPQTKH